MTRVPLGFIPDELSVPLDKILPSRKAQTGLITSVKFKQIRSSIEHIGLIEPLSVTEENKVTGQYTLLDGHVRLIALAELGYEEAPCLVSKDDEAYTYNSRINRLSTIQEHFMIRRAIERGVSMESLAKALSVDVSYIIKKVTLLDGICSEAADLLKDRKFSAEISRVIRKMKPTRQVECIELMVSANNITVAYAEALLVATPAEMVVGGKKPPKLNGVTQEQMSRMEREMANLQGQYKLVEQTYAEDVLNLVLARGYLAKLLDNKLVVRYIKQRRPEVLEQFEVIVETTSLDQ
ncbi:MAG: ParB N-terminal domain-containing protein [Betaproteobacteria bacterium]|nr:ParB N-terminal domain-containing protein [Betaproteobacteria bacterium]